MKIIVNYSNNSNKSSAVIFLLNGAKKRRNMAISNAKLVQRELGIIPLLVKVK